LTPVYFVASIWATGRQKVVKIAFIIGVISGPLLALVTPGFDILIAGIGGGTLAYAIDRYAIRARAKPTLAQEGA
ncbi:MAG TPA: AzlC family protein, partial [Rhizobium sp.]|nr:AzlC family protein [Rhizobium sp.]